MIKLVIPALLFPVIAGLVLAYFRFDRMVNKEVKTLYAEIVWKDEVVTEEMLEGLPPPVQRYLRYSGVVGKHWINTIFLSQTGQLKPSPEGKWFPFVAKEHYSVNPLRFIWQAKGPKEWLPVIHGRDGYNDGKGQLLIKLLSVFPVASAEGKEIDQGSMTRYLNEMMWFPTAFLSDNISWKTLDDHSAEVTLTVNDNSVKAVMYFDDEGKLVNFVAKRYFFLNNTFSLETWETPITSYGQFNGFNLPAKGSAVWKLKTGDYRYIDLSIEEVIYNKNIFN